MAQNCAAAESQTPIANSIWKLNHNEVITENSLVILYENYMSLTYCYVEKNGVFQNRYGVFRHSDMIGKPFGSVIVSSRKDLRGYMLLLAPTPELWSRVLRHRTQIVFTLDASCILFQTCIKSGSSVIESGTGSGALTTTVARAVAPFGHVYTFEFNETRAKMAEQEFKRNGLGDLVSVDCRDVYTDGFPDTLANKIDVVFLDLPCPWKAIQHATKMLKEGGRLASYSPCFEQVQKTCDALREAGYELIKTLETRLIPYSARKIDLLLMNFGSDEVNKSQYVSDPSNAAFKESDELTNSRKKVKREGDHIVAKKNDEIRGHTAFLTFAYKFF